MLEIHLKRPEFTYSACRPFTINKERKSFLLCVIDVFSKYTWVVALRGKKETSITNAFHQILHNLDVNCVNE